jgi:hypothetical protein
VPEACFICDKQMTARNSNITINVFISILNRSATIVFIANLDPTKHSNVKVIAYRLCSTYLG